jgi:hypothetical protein
MGRIARLASQALGAVLAAAQAAGSEGPGWAPLERETASEEAALARFEARPDEPHRALRAVRRMRAEGLGKRAFMDVRVWLDPDRGFTYEVEAEGGSRFLRDRAFRAMLEEERQAYASGRADRTALTADNYVLTPNGRGPGGLVRLRAVPRRREAALLDGCLVVTADTADLVRVEGRLARSPSFWISRVDVVRHYRRIRGHRVQVRLESTAHLRLFGDVRIVVDFDYEMVDGEELSVDS